MLARVRNCRARDCRRSGFAARKLPFANYGTRPLPDIGDFLIKGPVHFTYRLLAAINARISALLEQSFARTLAAWPPSGSFLPTPPRAIDPQQPLAM
jgi:hypothetical protein